VALDAAEEALNLCLILTSPGHADPAASSPLHQETQSEASGKQQDGDKWSVLDPHRGYEEDCHRRISPVECDSHRSTIYGLRRYSTVNRPGKTGDSIP